MSWEWQYNWWHLYGKSLGGTLRILVAEDSNGEIVGIAPLYLLRVKYKKIFWSNCLVPIGSTWRTGRAIVSEYLDFIIKRGTDEELIRTQLMNYLESNIDWDEFVYTYIEDDSPTVSLIEEHSKSNRWVCRKYEGTTCYIMALENGFESFLSDISSSGRRALIHKRKSLESHGEVDVIYADRSGIKAALSKLNGLHKQ